MYAGLKPLPAPLCTLRLSATSSLRSPPPGSGMKMRFSMRLRSASSMSQGKLVAASTITCSVHVQAELCRCKIVSAITCIGHDQATFCSCKVKRAHACKAVDALCRMHLSGEVGSCHQQGWHCCRGRLVHLLQSSAQCYSMPFTLRQLRRKTVGPLQSVRERSRVEGSPQCSCLMAAIMPGSIFILNSPFD